MIYNCGEEFNEIHKRRFSKMSLVDLIAEYDIICKVLDLDGSDNLFCLDELFTWQVLIAERCVELIRATLE